MRRKLRYGQFFVIFYLKISQEIETGIRWLLSRKQDLNISMGIWRSVLCITTNSPGVTVSPAQLMYRLLLNTFGNRGPLTSHHHLHDITTCYTCMPTLQAKTQKSITFMFMLHTKSWESTTCMPTLQAKTPSLPSACPCYTLSLQSLPPEFPCCMLILQSPPPAHQYCIPRLQSPPPAHPCCIPGLQSPPL